MFLIDKNVVQVVHSFLGIQRISEEHFEAWLKITFSNHLFKKITNINTYHNHIIYQQISIWFNLQFGSLHVSPILPKWHVSLRRSSPNKNAHSTIGLKLVFNYMYPTVRYFRVLYGKFSNNPHNTILPKLVSLHLYQSPFNDRCLEEKKSPLWVAGPKEDRSDLKHPAFGYRMLDYTSWN